MKVADGGGAIPKSSLTRTGSTVGTPYYMSLEQLRNSSAVDARADVYSLGVVLYECLSGRKPFLADTIGDLVYALCSGPPTQLGRIRPDLPGDMAEMVMRTLSANRDDRPPTMLDLALALLPHANPAFALWVKVDGKQPALFAMGGAQGPPQTPLTLTVTGAMGGAEGPPQTPLIATGGQGWGGRRRSLRRLRRCGRCRWCLRRGCRSRRGRGRGFPAWISMRGSGAIRPRRCTSRVSTGRSTSPTCRTSPRPGAIAIRRPAPTTWRG